MKAYHYGQPDMGFTLWALRIKSRRPWLGWVLFLPVLLIVVICWPTAWLFVKVGCFGHWLAGKIGIDSHEEWE